MKNRTIPFMFFAVVIVMLMLVAAAEVQATFQDCSPSELEIGTCTQMTALDASFAGYVTRLLPGYPVYDEIADTTEFKFEISLDTTYNPSAISHVDLEFKICDGTGCSADSATANDIVILTFEQFAAGTGGDPSTGYGDDWGADLVKLGGLPGEFRSGTFSITVLGKAYATLGKIGFKAGNDLFVGNILLPVCSASCPLVKFAAFTERTIVTETGYEIDILSNETTGCSIVTDYRDPEGDSHFATLTLVPIEEFFGITKGTLTPTLTGISTDENCLNLVVDDTEENSPSYCSGGWCWY